MPFHFVAAIAIIIVECCSLCVCELCDIFTEQQLLQHMKERNIFRRDFMAANLTDVAEDFTDLLSVARLEPVKSYECDDVCQSKTQQFATKFQRRDKSRVKPKTILTVLLERSVAAALRLPRGVRDAVQLAQQTQQAFLQRVIQLKIRMGSRRLVRSSNPQLLIPPAKLHVRRSRDVLQASQIGNVYLLDCILAGSHEQPGYSKLCSACRAVRELPENYFPRYLNQVTCTPDATCLDGHGQCVHRTMSFEVLRNVGTSICQLWESFIITVPVCCDCMLRTESYMRAVFMPH